MTLFDIISIVVFTLAGCSLILLICLNIEKIYNKIRNLCIEYLKPIPISYKGFKVGDRVHIICNEKYWFGDYTPRTDRIKAFDINEDKDITHIIFYKTNRYPCYTIFLSKAKSTKDHYPSWF